MCHLMGFLPSKKVRTLTSKAKTFDRPNFLSHIAKVVVPKSIDSRRTVIGDAFNTLHKQRQTVVTTKSDHEQQNNYLLTVCILSLQTRGEGTSTKETYRRKTQRRVRMRCRGDPVVELFLLYGLSFMNMMRSMCPSCCGG
jgi:hypothetical protein